MFHRLPFILATAATLAVVAFVFAAVSPSFTPDSTAHADHSNRPTVSIKAVMPEVGEEGRSVTVTLKLSRSLTDDEEWCYPGDGPSQTPNPGKCIEGGLKIRDNYNDHLNEEGHNPADIDWKFVFRGSQLEDRINVEIADDECITPDRQLEIWIDTAYQDRDDHPNETKYGYDIDTKRHYVPVNGNDTANDTDCNPVDEGTTEEAHYNKAPTFDDRESPPEFSVNENTTAGQDVGSPVSATDPENDTLTYSLQGQDAASFDIDSATGQIETKAPLDHETKDTYHVAVFVRDSKNIHGNSDSVYDNSIDVTIKVDNVNEPPAFDANLPIAFDIVENTADGENIGSPITATDPDNTSANPNKDTLNYTLDDGDGASFGIDAGQIKTKDPLDHETKATYTVTVTATDNGGETDTHNLTITVTDDTTEQPRFDEKYADGEASIARSVAENTEAGQAVGDPVSATDDDGDTLTFSLVGTDAASFDIDTTSGQIKTKTGIDLDHETTPSYSVTVSVTDSEDDAGDIEQTPVEDATIDVTINVTDVNEGPAFADDAPTTLEVAENTAADSGHRQRLHSHGPRGRHAADLLAGRHRCRVVRHRRYDRAAQDQGRPRLRDQGSPTP